MTGDREVQATRGFNDTQLMLARDAGDERGGGARGTIRRLTTGIHVLMVHVKKELPFLATKTSNA